MINKYLMVHYIMIMLIIMIFLSYKMFWLKTHQGYPIFLKCREMFKIIIIYAHIFVTYSFMQTFLKIPSNPMVKI
jgi:hypothetical protein